MVSASAFTAMVSSSFLELTWSIRIITSCATSFGSLMTRLGDCPLGLVGPLVLFLGGWVDAWVAGFSAGVVLLMVLFD